MQISSTPAGMNVQYEYVEVDENAISVKEATRTKLLSLKDWALECLTKLKSKQGLAIRREKRATKLVATVMGRANRITRTTSAALFLIFWLPFFTLNMYHVYCRWWTAQWTPLLEDAFQVATWLGYINSCINPLIYAMINIKFRMAFADLLGCGDGERRDRQVEFMAIASSTSRKPAGAWPPALLCVKTAKHRRRH